jgi:hypothetical protein
MIVEEQHLRPTNNRDAAACFASSPFCFLSGCTTHNEYQPFEAIFRRLPNWILLPFECRKNVTRLKKITTKAKASL